MQFRLQSLALTLLIASGPIFGQTITVDWTVQVTVNAARARQHAAAAKAAEQALGMLGGGVSVATLTDTLAISGNRYTLSSHARVNPLLASLLPSSTATRSSAGIAGGGYLMSQQFTETRTKGNERVVKIDYGTKIASYYKAGQITKRESVRFRTADSATMPYLFYKQPIPTTTTTVAATDGISTRIFVLDPSQDIVTIDGTRVSATKLTRRLTNQADAGFVLWIRKTDGFPLKARVDLNGKYGVILEQALQKLPR